VIGLIPFRRPSPERGLRSDSNADQSAVGDESLIIDTTSRTVKVLFSPPAMHALLPNSTETPQTPVLDLVTVQNEESIRQSIETMGMDQEKDLTTSMANCHTLEDAQVSMPCEDDAHAEPQDETSYTSREDSHESEVPHMTSAGDVDVTSAHLREYLPEPGLAIQQESEDLSSSVQGSDASPSDEEIVRSFPDLSVMDAGNQDQYNPRSSQDLELSPESVAADVDETTASESSYAEPEDNGRDPTPLTLGNDRTSSTAGAEISEVALEGKPHSSDTLLAESQEDVPVKSVEVDDNDELCEEGQIGESQYLGPVQRIQADKDMRLDDDDGQIAESIQTIPAQMTEMEEDARPTEEDHAADPPLSFPAAPCVATSFTSSLHGDDDDTALLKSFLSRAKAKKAADAASQSSQEGLSPLKVTRTALSEVHNNSSLLQKTDSVPEKPPTKSSSPEMVANGELDEPPEPAGRRSARGRIAARQKVVKDTSNSIPVRRADGPEHIILQKSESQELALTTRANTKRNKGEAKPPKQKMKDLVSATADDKEMQLQRRRGLKSVSWDDTPVYFGVESTTEDAKEAPQPPARHLRRLGAVNGTPAPKKMAAAPVASPKKVTREVVGTPAPKRRGRSRV
jgi:hypothetical protein